MYRLLLSLSIFLTRFLYPASVNGSVPSKRERSTFIVHMDTSLAPASISDHHLWYASTVESLKAVVGDGKNDGPVLLYSYHNVINGFSAALSFEELERLTQVSGFVSAYADKKMAVDTTRSPEFLSLNSHSGIWPASNYGADAIVGVIDSGVWPESKSFSDAGITSPIPARWKGRCAGGENFPSSSCNSKLIGARYFNKGLRAALPDIKTIPNSARDTGGHGTHTASTAAGNFVAGASYFGYATGTAKGVAPHARVAIYKAVFDEGIYDSDVIAAVDQAVADGVDVLSLSISHTEYVPLHRDAFAIASFGAMEKGVLFSTSAGNLGPDGGSTFKGIPWAMVAAAGSLDRKFAGTLTVGSGRTFVGWSLFPAIAYVHSAHLVYNATLSSCNSSVLLAEAPGAVIICDHAGDLRVLSHQLFYVAASPVLAAVFILDELDQSDIEYFPCPGVVVRPTDAAAVIKYAKHSGRKATATMKFHQTIVGTKPAPVVADYSSRGPSREFQSIMKPDVMAPGTNVLAAYLPDKPSALIGSASYLASSYILMSGTSVACPHASGAAALLKAAHPDWSPAAIRSALMTTARPLDNTLGPIRDKGRNMSFASPLAMGSGLIDPNRAMDPGLIYEATAQDYVNLICSKNFTAKQIQTISRSKSYNCSKPSSDLNYPSFMAFYSNDSATKKTVRTFRRTLTNVGEEGATYEVEVIPPKKAIVRVQPTEVRFGKKGEKQSYVVRVEHGRMSRKTEVSFGWITWNEKNGKRTVRSPVVLSPAA